MKNIVRNKITLLLALCILSVMQMHAQENAAQEMRAKATTLRSEIKKKEAILLSSQKDINSRLNNLNIITAKIEEYKGLVAVLQKEVSALNAKMRSTDKEIGAINSEIASRERDIEASRAEYAEALRMARKYSNFENKLLFIFSSEDFNTMVRRYRYANDYMNAHKELADTLKGKLAQLEDKREELNNKRAELDKARSAKNASLKEQESERKRIQNLEKEQRTIIESLKKENKKVEAQLKKQRDELDKLNAAIKKEVERVLAEERRKNAAKKEEPAKSVAREKSKEQKNLASYTTPPGLLNLSGSFVKNKAKLPVPITGPYLLVGKFGEKNAVEGKGNVVLNNGGLTFKGTKGAKARSVFKGVVSTVFYHNDYVCVLIRHDRYITVYCNVENVTVRGGDVVDAGDVIGDVSIDVEDGNPSLLFQLYDERKLLDPTGWLKLN